MHRRRTTRGRWPGTPRRCRPRRVAPSGPAGWCARSRRPGVAAVVVVGLLGAAQADVDRVDPHLRRPLHRQRRVSESSPALAAPYAAIVGRGPVGGDRGDVDDRAAAPLLLHHRVGGLGDQQRGQQVEPDDLVVEPRRRGRGVGAGAPPALLTSTSSRPASATMPPPAPGPPRGRGRRRRGGRARHGSASEREQVTTGAPAARNASVMPSPIPRVPPVTSTTRPDEVERERHAATLPSNCLVVTRKAPMPITSELRPDGIRVVTMDHPRSTR